MTASQIVAGEEIPPPPTKFNNLIFVHLPKSAGTTLNHILDSQYRGQKICVIHPAHGVSLEAFEKLPTETLAQIRLLRGHMPFGFHRLLSGSTTYVTVLRKPIDRIASHYYYVLGSPSHYLYSTVVSKNLDIADYATGDLSGELDNGQTRLLAGDYGQVPFGQCDRALLEKAKSNLLQHFSVFGLAERFDETLLLMKVKLGWRHSPYYRKENITRNKPATLDISREAVQRIEKYNQWDCELYEWVTQKFENEVLANNRRLDWELRKFKVTNKSFQVLASIKKTGREQIRKLLNA